MNESEREKSKNLINGESSFTVIDILNSGINLEPTNCRHCHKGAFWNHGMLSVMCEHCGLIDDGSNLQEQINTQGVEVIK